MCCFRCEEVLLLEGLQLHKGRLQECFHRKRLQVQACLQQRSGGGGGFHPYRARGGQRGRGSGAVAAVSAAEAAATETRKSEKEYILLKGIKEKKNVITRKSESKCKK